MSEFITVIPENETTPERAFWDKFIQVLDKVHDMTIAEASEEIEPFDLIETLEAMRGEDKQDAITLLFNYVIMIETPRATSTSDDFNEVWAFLGEYGFEPEE